MKFVTALEFSSLTDTGVVRSHNEDFVAISPDYGIAILAERIGGYCADEVLSSIVTSVLQGVLGKRLVLRPAASPTAVRHDRQIHRLLAESIQQVNFTVLDAARLDRAYNGHQARYRIIPRR